MRMSIIAASSWSENVQPTSLLAIFMKVDCSTWALKIWHKFSDFVGNASNCEVITSSSVAARPMRTISVPAAMAGRAKV